MPTVNAIIAREKANVGVEEVPRGSNKQPYAAIAGHRNGEPWCATFQVAMFKRVGIALPKGATTASTVLNEAAFKKAKRLYSKPKVGDIGFLFFPSLGRVAHTFLVYKVDATYVYTIEGNSNTNGSREGYEVCLRKRKIARTPGMAYIRSYGRPVYSATPVKPPVKPPVVTPPAKDKVTLELLNANDAAILKGIDSLEKLLTQQKGTS